MADLNILCHASSSEEETSRLAISDHSRRSKDSSAGARRPSLISMNRNIDDLPNETMIEILCRLPSHNSVSQCKCVSKRWCTLISDPSFIGHFLRIQSDRRTPIIHSLVDSYGDELFTTKVFERLRSFLSLKRRSTIEATCNDLVLCSEEKDGRLDFFICNPRTMQVVNLPPTPGSCHPRLAVGFICEPYYEDDKAQHKDLNSKLANTNAEYRCKVVRLFRSYYYDNEDMSQDCVKIQIQVFSSDTGEWTQSAASCPRGFPAGAIWYLNFSAFVSNGILYWSTRTRLIGLDMFRTNIISTSSENMIDHYQFHVIDFDQSLIVDINRFLTDHRFVVIYRGCVRLHLIDNDHIEPKVFVFELKEQVLHQMVVDRTRILGLRDIKLYLLDNYILPENEIYDGFDGFIAFDWDDLDVAYLRVDDDIVKYNVGTGRWSEMGVKPLSGIIYQYVLPWWPTPVPTLPQHDPGKQA